MNAPEFINLPCGGKDTKKRCPYTGLSRSTLYNLTVPCAANGNKPPVPAKSLRKKGNMRGIWLIPYAKLIAYLHELPDSVEDKISAPELSAPPAPQVAREGDAKRKQADRAQKG